MISIGLFWVVDMIYKRIRELREDNDLTQSEVGKAINVRQRNYSYYENGERVIPPWVLCKIADYFDTSVDFLLEQTDERKPYPKRQQK